MNRMGKILTACVISASMLFAVPAAYGQEETESEQALLQIGEAKEEGDYLVELTNSTGKTITSVAISVDGEEMSPNMLKEDAVFEYKLAEAPENAYALPPVCRSAAVPFQRAPRPMLFF